MIRHLPPDVVSKIAAGEVVERPASVVKELTENAVDANATRIEIVLEDGGTSLIQVIDNGSGMGEEDARLCLLPHTTSKITSADDLFKLSTLGFRGEALSSIAVVSQFTLETREKNHIAGYRVSFDEALRPVALNPGTVVTVKHLFHNVPARRKFLKSAATEYTHILRYLQQFALIHVDLELKVIHNGKVVFHSFPSDLMVRIRDILGVEFSKSMIPVTGYHGSYSVTGYIGKPSFIISTHKNQFLTVNKRPVFDTFLSRSVLEVYGTLIPRGYYPSFVLQLMSPPDSVDVNVHPRKTEVKFEKPFEVADLVKKAVMSSLRQHDLTDVKTFVPSKSLSTSFSARTSSIPKKETLFESPSFSSGITLIKKSSLDERGWKVLGQIHQSLILVETEDSLQVFDQHAVSEIVNYQKLMKERRVGTLQSQHLLFPLESEVSREEKGLLDEHHELFERLGWSIDLLTEKSIQVSALPALLKVDQLIRNLREMLALLQDDQKLSMSQKEMELLKYEACRSAVMFGDSLSDLEMKALLNDWLVTEHNAACEHGRPAAARITLHEMKKYFRR